MTTEDKIVCPLCEELVEIWGYRVSNSFYGSDTAYRMAEHWSNVTSTGKLWQVICPLSNADVKPQKPKEIK